MSGTKPRPCVIESVSAPPYDALTTPTGDRMRILFVLHTFPPETWGGTELHAQSVAKSMSREHDVRVFCRSGDPRLPHGHLSHGFQDGLLVARFNNLFEGYEDIGSIHTDEAAHSAFVEELDSYRPDVVHVHHLTNLSTTIIDECKTRGLPVVFTVHDFWPVCPRGQRLHPSGQICETIDRALCHTCLAGLWPDWIDAADAPDGPVSIGSETPHLLSEFDERIAHIMGLCDIILTPSEFHRAKMLEEVELDPRRTLALPHGLDHDLFDGIHDPEPRPKVIGYIGTVIPVKGVEVLIDAFNILGDPAIELRIHGNAPVFHDDHDYLAELRDRSQGPGRVRFMGHYDNGALPGILADIDILVVPSLWWETFSLTIREAMLAGVPVVASDIGAMHEALSTSRAGLSFETGNAADLARVLRRLIKDRSLRQRHANRRLEVKTLQRNAEELLEVYRQASEIAEKRKDSIVAKRPIFKRRRAPLETSDKDLTIGVEKTGDGDVRIESSVERGDSTRVVFRLDYGSSTESNEVKLTIDFAKDGAVTSPQAAKPQAENLEKVVPKDADVGGAALASTQEKGFDSQRIEESMYSQDESRVSKDVKRLDDMVTDTTLPEGDRVVSDTEKSDDEPPRKRRRRQRRRRTGGDEAAEEAPKREPRPAAGEKPAGEEVVWTGGAKWGLPEDDSKVPEPPKKAPYHRTGRQPNVNKSDTGGSFGEGLGED